MVFLRLFWGMAPLFYRIEYFIRLEQGSPVRGEKERQPAPPVNEHLRGRAAWRDQDVVDFVEEKGLHSFEDVYDLLDNVEDLTQMQVVSQNPQPIAGMYSATNVQQGCRSYILPPVGGRKVPDWGASRSGWEQNHVRRQFKGRVMQDKRRELQGEI